MESIVRQTRSYRTIGGSAESQSCSLAIVAIDRTVTDSVKAWIASRVRLVLANYDQAACSHSECSLAPRTRQTRLRQVFWLELTGYDASPLVWLGGFRRRVSEQSVNNLPPNTG